MLSPGRPVQLVDVFFIEVFANKGLQFLGLEESRARGARPERRRHVVGVRGQAEGRVLCSYAQTHSDLSEHPSERSQDAAVLA